MLGSTTLIWLALSRDMTNPEPELRPSADQVVRSCDRLLRAFTERRVFHDSEFWKERPSISRLSPDIDTKMGTPDWMLGSPDSNFSFLNDSAYEPAPRSDSPPPPTRVPYSSGHSRHSAAFDPFNDRPSTRPPRYSTPAHRSTYASTPLTAPLPTVPLDHLSDSRRDHSYHAPRGTYHKPMPRPTSRPASSYDSRHSTSQGLSISRPGSRNHADPANSFNFAINLNRPSDREPGGDPFPTSTETDVGSRYSFPSGPDGVSYPDWFSPKGPAPSDTLRAPTPYAGGDPTPRARTPQSSFKLNPYQ